MSENIFSAVLTLSLLAGGTITFGSEALQPRQVTVARHSATLPPVTVTGQRMTATLPPVTVIGHRVAAADRVTLPTVVVTGRRTIEATTETEVAAETSSVEHRVQ
jgi:hypothetical protein